MMAILVGEMSGVSVNDVMNFDDKDFSFWLDRLEEYHKWVNKNGGKK